MHYNAFAYILLAYSRAVKHCQFPSLAAPIPLLISTSLSIFPTRLCYYHALQVQQCFWNFLDWDGIVEYLTLCTVMVRVPLPTCLPSSDGLSSRSLAQHSLALSLALSRVNTLSVSVPCAYFGKNALYQNGSVLEDLSRLQERVTTTTFLFSRCMGFTFSHFCFPS